MSKIEVDNLICRAIQVRENAHAPYSKFKVGAALLTEDGSVFCGCNVENASYGLALCAERAAIAAAVSAGIRSYRAIAIAADSIASPCGACRQFLAEFGNEIEVVSVAAADPETMRRWTVGELLPDGFQLKTN